LRWKVQPEQLQLASQRARKAYLTEGAPAHLDAALELGLIGCPDRDRERRAQERRATRGLQIREQIASLLGALVADVRDPLLAVGLCPHDLLGLLAPAPREPPSELVVEQACVQ